jgi:putative transposase
MRSLRTFAAVQATVSNHFNQERNLFSRNSFKLNRAVAGTKWLRFCAGQVAASLS